MVERSSLRSRLEVLRLDAAPRLLDPASGDRIIHCFDGAIELAMRAGAAAGTLQSNCTAILSIAAGAPDDWQLTTPAGRRATAAIIDLMPA
jgi:hypothetical protein